MIFGIGTDIVRVSRIEQALARHGERFARRILAEHEWDEFQAHPRQAYFLAKRFAAKEAAAKAFGTGFRNGLALRHISVTHDPAGKPQLCFTDEAERLRIQLGVGEAFLSLADEQDVAVAFVTLLRQSPLSR